MEEIKGFRKNFIILSVFYVIAGVVLLFWPAMSIELFCRVLGIAMLIIGIAHIIIYFTKDHMMNIMQMDLVIGVMCAAFGAFLLLHPDFVETALPFAVGILLLIGAIVKLQNALDMKHMKFKYWKVVLFFSIVMMVLGGILIYNPFAGQVLLMFIGVSLMVDGLVNIVSMLCISHLMKKAAKAVKMAGTAKTAHGTEVIDVKAQGNELEIRK